MRNELKRTKKEENDTKCEVNRAARFDLLQQEIGILCLRTLALSVVASIDTIGCAHAEQHSRRGLVEAAPSLITKCARRKRW